LAGGVAAFFLAGGVAVALLIVLFLFGLNHTVCV